MTSVVLQGVPVRLFRAWEEHSDALLREYVLGVAGPDQPYSGRDVARARAARMAVAAQVARAAEPANPSSVDVSVALPHPITGADFSMLQAVLEDAIACSVRGEFLTLPSLPEIVALRNWVCEEVLAQAAGAPPTPWEGAAVHADAELPLPAWEGLEALPADRAWLAGDDQNRIIGASPVARRLLHWDEHDIVGQRIISVIPPALREAHVAAFTVATLNGEYRLLGKPLPLDAWTRDGNEVPITLLLERHAAGARTVYVAWLDAAASEGCE